MTRGLFRISALLALGLLGAAAPAHAQVRVSVEQSYEQTRWHFDSPSSFNTSTLVPHFFEQEYALDNRWLTVEASYRAGVDWHTSFGATPVRSDTATDYDTFFNPDGEVWVSGTTGLAKLHSLRLTQAVDLGRIGGIRFSGGYGLRVDRADFLDGDRTDVRNGVVVTRTVVTTREYTSGQTHEVFIEGTHTRELSANWSLRVSGHASPASVQRLAIQLPDKYPGATLVYRTTNLTASGRLEFVGGHRRWPLTLSLGGTRTVNYSSEQTMDRSGVRIGVGIGRSW